MPADRRLLNVVAPAHAQRIGPTRVTIAVSDPANKLSGFRTVDLVNGTYTGRLEEQIALGGDGPFHLDISSDGKTIAYVAERGDRPAEVWITQDELTHSNRITNLNPQVTRLSLGDTRLVQWSGPQGDVLRGALLMPGNYELPARAEETFVGLRRLAKPVVYVRYEGEEHHPGSWTIANATDYWNRIFAWLDKYLAPGEP